VELAQLGIRDDVPGVIPIVVFGGGFWPTVLAVVIGFSPGRRRGRPLVDVGPRFGVPQLVHRAVHSAIWVTSCQLV